MQYLKDLLKDFLKFTVYMVYIFILRFYASLIISEIIDWKGAIIAIMIIIGIFYAVDSIILLEKNKKYHMYFTLIMIIAPFIIKQAYV